MKKFLIVLLLSSGAALNASLVLDAQAVQPMGGVDTRPGTDRQTFLPGAVRQSDSVSTDSMSSIDSKQVTGTLLGGAKDRIKNLGNEVSDAVKEEFTSLRNDLAKEFEEAKADAMKEVNAVKEVLREELSSARKELTKSIASMTVNIIKSAPGMAATGWKNATSLVSGWLGYGKKNNQATNAEAAKAEAITKEVAELLEKNHDQEKEVSVRK